ncbi:MAG: CoA pyrophosphatase [Pseudomonadota bacterium]
MTQGETLRAPILNPLAVPVAGNDAHLPAVDATRLTAQALRSRFASPPAWRPETLGDGRLFQGRNRAAASVLVPLVERVEGITVLLTQRTAHLRDHAGQISFPGGRAETSDDDAVATALREAEEEVGLTRGHIEVIGSLPEYRTVTYYDVTPVVALVRPPFTLALDAHEVADAFEVPLSFLMTPANHQRHSFELDGYRREFLSMPWRRPDERGGAPYFIWGATAAMLRNLYRFLSA